MPIAYSYIRFSSERQSLGDSVRRQSTMAQEYIENHPELNLILDVELNMSDLGISAFSRKNITDGALGRFFDLIYEGKIEEGSYLLLENLDRFSRAPAWQATHDLTTLVKAGIVVVTLCDEQVFSRETLDAESGSFKLMQSVMTFMRANQESEIKRNRISRAWRNKMDKIKDGIQLTKKVPFWIDPNNKNKVLADKVEIVKKIYKLSADGLGAMTIASLLNDSKTPTPSNRSKAWAISSVKKVLNSQAVIGKLVTADGQTHEAYFPRVISQRLWERTRLLEKTSKGTRNSLETHPLSGLCYCIKCGARAQRSGKTGRVRKDGTKNIWRTLVCANSLNRASGCSYRSISYDLILDAVKSTIFQSQYVEPADDIGKELHHLEWGLSHLEDLFEEVKDKVKTDKSNLVARQEYSQLTIEIDSTRKRIEQLKEMKRPITARQVEGARMAILNERKVLNANFRMIFKRIEIDFENRFLRSQSHDGKIVEAELMSAKDIEKIEPL